MDFTQVETRFKELKEKHYAGAITEEEFKAQLEELMIQDEEGRWWMIGYETGQWYYHDGERWVPAESPPVAERGVGEPSPVTTGPSPVTAVPSLPLNRLAIAALLSGVAGLVIVPVIGSILALIFGYRARNDIRQRPRETSGEGLAKASIVVGWIGLGLWLLTLCCWITFGLLSGGGSFG